MRCKINQGLASSGELIIIASPRGMEPAAPPQGIPPPLAVADMDVVEYALPDMDWV